MSWDAHLVCTSCHSCKHETNYTHNINPMIAEAMRVVGLDEPGSHFLVGPTWWKALNGLTGPEGAEFLRPIVNELKSDPSKYDAMNPGNGWGSRAELAGILDHMIRAVEDLGKTPTMWIVTG